MIGQSKCRQLLVMYLEVDELLEELDRIIQLNLITV